MSSGKRQVPSTRVISPSPTPSERSVQDGYFTKQTASAPQSISEDGDAADPEFARARSRSRSPGLAKRGSRRMDGMTPIDEKAPDAIGNGKPTRRKAHNAQSKQDNDGLLKPISTGFGAKYWRELSRSPSPLGLIPIHREWRTFVHKHEIPRKALHVSIGFLTLWLYTIGKQLSDIHPVLLSLLVPIFLVDLLRFSYEPFNRVYIRFLGPFMRESEAHDRFNGVISYLGGVWAVMYFCPKDVGVISVLLLSFCDTAASTFGRMWGKYTPRIRRGKSLAGSIAAFLFGVASAVLFYAVVAPLAPSSWNQGKNKFAFDGHLSLPPRARRTLGLDASQATISGNEALLVVSVVSGFVASASEAIDFFGLDDNLTIPILCGLGLGAFLRTFG